VEDNQLNKRSKSFLINNSTKKKKVNIIPLIDIIFLMLVFFMLATNFQENKEIEILVNKTSSKNIKENKTLELFLRNDGRLEIFNNLISQKKIEEKIINIWDKSNYSGVLIICDSKTNSQNLITLMDSFKKLGIKNVNFTIKNDDT
tara:strand:- start:14 stop:451 length:438 start_codon:yes stop_codon:yes gene_type:complete